MRWSERLAALVQISDEIPPSACSDVFSRQPSLILFSLGGKSLDMSRTKFYSFWRAPLGLWIVRVVFSLHGLLLLAVGVVTIWDGTTGSTFTMYKLQMSGRPFSTIVEYSSSPHSLYWGFLALYSGICLGVGSLFALIGYAATFRAVIPGYWKKKTPA